MSVTTLVRCVPLSLAQWFQHVEGKHIVASLPVPPFAHLLHPPVCLPVSSFRSPDRFVYSIVDLPPLFVSSSHLLHLCLFYLP